MVCAGPQCGTSSFSAQVVAQPSKASKIKKGATICQRLLKKCQFWLTRPTAEGLRAAQAEQAPGSAFAPEPEPAFR